MNYLTWVCQDNKDSKRKTSNINITVLCEDISPCQCWGSCLLCRRCVVPPLLCWAAAVWCLWPPVCGDPESPEPVCRSGKPCEPWDHPQSSDWLSGYMGWSRWHTSPASESPSLHTEPCRDREHIRPPKNPPGPPFRTPHPADETLRFNPWCWSNCHLSKHSS